ncbi:uncharacterized protein LOC127138135 [Lathyrus oleraceus]|uniref:uncharacterized protein LOC127138135 n=1 Tax=Pisum sativum TaxID=3888 RepID=UPI0021D2E010|nr:uncharacterized protein LOC127138135 [Pisum sativum]
MAEDNTGWIRLGRVSQTASVRREMTATRTTRPRDADMVHPDVFPKQVVSLNVQSVVVNAVDVGNKCKIEQEFESCDQMLQWIRMEASKLGFVVVIGRFDNDSDRRYAFVTMKYERSGKYRTPLRIFKRDDTGSRKCECPFKEEKKCVDDMTLNLVQPKNILATLKWKRPENISKIKKVYNIRYRTCEDGVIVRDIFWTHPDSIKLFNTFPTMLILDSTCKINKYRLPLLEMVGVTSTKKTYSIGFAFLECEKEDNLTWALEVCQTLLKDQGVMPKVIATDRDIALMKSVAKVKKKIVCAWTDNVINLGNTITNKVEYAHATLKNWLENSTCNLCRDWDSMNHMFQNHHNEIHTSFCRSIAILEHRFKDNNLYSRLVGNISRASLNYIFHEAK